MNEMECLIDEKAREIALHIGGNYKNSYNYAKACLISVYEETMKLNIMQNSKTNDRIVINIEKMELHLK